jgi:hypothetical protein
MRGLMIFILHQYYLGYQIKKNEMGRTYCTNRQEERCIHTSGESEGKRPFVKPKCRWESNSTMDLKEFSWEGMKRKALTQDRH